MAIPDRLNPRVWLRDWLNKATPAERTEISQRGEFSVLAARHTIKLENGEIVGLESSESPSVISRLICEAAARDLTAPSDWNRFVTPRRPSICERASRLAKRAVRRVLPWLR